MIVALTWFVRHHVSQLQGVDTDTACTASGARGQSPEAEPRSSSHLEARARSPAPRAGAAGAVIPHLTPHVEAPLRSDPACAESDSNDADNGEAAREASNNNPLATDVSRESSWDSSHSPRMTRASGTTPECAPSPSSLGVRSRTPSYTGTPGAAGGRARMSPAAPPPESLSEPPSPASDTIYDKLANVFGLLAADPAPVVAQYGKAALMACGFDISQLPTHDSHGGAGGGGPGSVAGSSVASLHSTHLASLGQARRLPCCFAVSLLLLLCILAATCQACSTMLIG
jgi:hypothetical protein